MPSGAICTVKPERELRTEVLPNSLGEPFTPSAGMPSHFSLTLGLQRILEANAKILLTR